MAPPIELLQALCLTLSPDHALRTTASTQLNEWSTQEGYYLSLVDTFSSRTHHEGVTRDVRLQAVLQFRNAIQGYWRRGSPNAIKLREKEAIRPRLLNLIDEPDNSIAKNAAESIGKIARIDYNDNWSELPQTLLQHLQSSLTPNYQPLLLHRTLLIIHYTIKNLMANRMPKGRIVLQKFRNFLFLALKHVYETLLGRVVEGNGYGREDVVNTHLAFKCLANLTVYGFASAHEAPEARDFFGSTVATFERLMSIRHSLLTTSPPTSSDTIIPITKNVIAIIKLYKRLQDHDNLVFQGMGVTEGVLNIVWMVVKNSSVDSDRLIGGIDSAYPEKLVVLSLGLLQALFTSWGSQPALSLPIGFVGEIVGTLLYGLLPLREEDLRKWEEDVEGWLNEEESDLKDVALRPATDSLLQGLLLIHSEQVTPSLIALLEQTRAPTNMKELLFKDAVYTAFGHCAGQLKKAFDFEGWLRGPLVSEAHDTEPSNLIIRRRIAWLFGLCIGEDLEIITRSSIYSTIVHLLSRNESTDLAIRLTAVPSLAKAVDTWDFDLDSFLPLLGRVTEEIRVLMGESESVDSQMRLNRTLAVVIERVGSHILPYADQLTHLLSNSWTTSASWTDEGDKQHFQTRILVTFTKLAAALGEQSQGLHSLANAIIRHGVDSSLPSSVYLQEDALELWQILLRRTPVLTPDLISLLPSLAALISEAKDTLPRVLKILESYCLIDGTQVLQHCSTELFIAFESILGNLSIQASKVILHALDTVFQTCPAQLWASVLESSGTLEKLVVGLGESDAITVCKHLQTISRIIVGSESALFSHLLQALAARSGKTEDDVLTVLINSYCDRVLPQLDNMAQGAQTKLAALALANLVVTQRPSVLSRLGEIMNLWNSALAQTAESPEGDSELYEDEYDERDWDDGETLEPARRAALSSRDPVHSIKLSTLISQKIAEAQVLNGPSFEMVHLASVDTTITEELQKRLAGVIEG